MKKIIVIAGVLLAGCGNNPPVPDWQMNAHNGIDRATAAYMEGNTRIEAAEFKRARSALASTGKVDLMIRAELIQCAARVASLVFEDCAGYDKLAQDASPADRAYAAYLAGRLPGVGRSVAAAPAASTTTAAGAPLSAADIGLLPAQHQPVAAATSDAAAASAVQAIADPLSRLVASGVLLRAGRATPQILADAVETASAQGWRRPLLAWLGVQAMRAEQAGDTAEAQRIKRRIDLVTEK
ncbi:MULTISPECIES: hypothetical protein [unclassified Duganella]|uniref:hypothetical protein n=1 Tax=unclassified Duganella TaxID=2636909 RepID=UPI00088CD1F8|nr:MULTISPECIES: hypothetical protein [unclassified Duganella]SDF51799.1 hypothetical protein SAMN05216320_101447 [Duganella sp. OV458]SDI75380.1 hypothetical protein SAMN05428973_101975 [Duganella sp. OV510]